MRTRGRLDGDVALRRLRRMRSRTGKRRKRGSARCRNGHRDAFCLGGVHSGGSLPLLGRSPHGRLRPRHLDWPQPCTRGRRMLRYMIGTAATHRCWGGPRAVGARRFGHARRRHGAVASRSCTVTSRGPRRSGFAWRAAPYRLHSPRHSAPICRLQSPRGMSESAAAMGRSPRGWPHLAQDPGQARQLGATAADHRSAGRTHSSRPAPCTRSTPRCSTGNVVAAPLTTQHVAL